MTGTIPVRVVDAFAAAPFAGNPAAVCRLPAWPDDSRLADIAREMNLSETAFLVRARGVTHELRWFTPAVEVPLCGHATLASAHVLWEDGILPPDAVARFRTRRSGDLAARREPGGIIELDLPLDPVVRIDPPAGLAAALGADPVAVARAAGGNLLVELASAGAVRSLAPDFGWLATEVEDGVIVTAASDDPRFAIVSRYFAPRVGIAEDPVTGSAHCALAPWWAPRLGTATFEAHQASARGGLLRVTLRGDRVGVAGRAVTVLRGELVA